MLVFGFGRVGFCFGRVGFCFGCVGFCFGRVGFCFGRVGFCFGRLRLQVNPKLAPKHHRPGRKAGTKSLQFGAENAIFWQVNWLNLVASEMLFW